MVTLIFNTLVTELEPHTKKMCDGMRAKGISVLSYFITDYDVCDDDYDVKGRKMYGKDFEFIKPTNMIM